MLMSIKTTRRLVRLLSLSVAAAALSNCAGFGPVATPVAPPSLGEDSFTSFDGSEFPYKLWSSRARARQVLIGFHGIAGASGDFRNLGAHLRRHSPGTALYAPELRGQGHDPVDSRRGDIRSAEDWFEDARTFHRLVQERHPEARFIWCGESMGSLIALHALASGEKDARCDAIIIASPVVSISRHIPPLRRQALRLGSMLFPRMRVSLESVAGHDEVRITRDAIHQEQTANNPYHVSRFTLRLLSHLGHLIETAPEAAARVEVPTLLLHAGNDVFSKPEEIEDFARTFPPSTPVTRNLYPASYHLLFFDHEQDRVLADLTEWIDALP